MYILSEFRAFIKNAFTTWAYPNVSSLSGDVLTILVLVSGIFTFLLSLRLRGYDNYKETLIGLAGLIIGVLIYVEQEGYIPLALGVLTVVVIFPLLLIFFKYFKKIDFKLYFIPVFVLAPFFIPFILLGRSSLLLIKLILNDKLDSKKVNLIGILLIIITIVVAYPFVEPVGTGLVINHFE